MKLIIYTNFTIHIVGGTSIIVPERHFKIKKNKSDVESLPKEEVINCSCFSNQEDGLMIQVMIDYYLKYFVIN